MTDNSSIPLVAVLAVSRPDFHLALKWLKWAAYMSWKSGRAYPVGVFHTQALLREQQDLIRAHDGIFLPKCLRFRTPPELYEHGYAPSANYQFRTALEMVEREFPGHAMLFCEADTVPMRPTWFDEIEAEWQACGMPFLGDYIDHKTPFGNIPHMSGVAVYGPDWRIHAPSFLQLPGPNPEQGWDSQCSHETVPKMARSKTIQQIWRPPVATEAWVAANIRPETALFHQSKDGSVIDVLCDRLDGDRIPLGAPIAESSYPYAEPKPAPFGPRVAILIVSYAKDIDFLRYCLASIARFASGFSEVVLVVPRHEAEAFKWIRRGVRVELFDEPAGKGMMAHEVQKCRADQWCPSADFIVHLDADCLFFRAVTPAAYVKDGQACNLRERYSDVKNPNRHIWRECVKRATGIWAEFECMVAHPQVHPAAVYKATREAVEQFTHQPFDDYVLSCKNDYPQGFAEFPTLHAVGETACPGLYSYTDYDHAADARAMGLDPGSYQFRYQRNRDYLVEFWSPGGMARYKGDCDAVLAGRLPEYWIK